MSIKLGAYQLVPGCDVDYTDWDDVKLIVKQHQMATALGGKRVVNKHFESLNIDEIVATFNPENDCDEFIELYNIVVAKVKGL